MTDWCHRKLKKTTTNSSEVQFTHVSGYWMLCRSRTHQNTRPLRRSLERPRGPIGSGRATGCLPHHGSQDKEVVPFGPPPLLLLLREGGRVSDVGSFFFPLSFSRPFFFYLRHRARKGGWIKKRDRSPTYGSLRLLWPSTV